VEISLSKDEGLPYFVVSHFMHFYTTDLMIDDPNR